MELLLPIQIEPSLKDKRVIYVVKKAAGFKLDFRVFRMVH